MTTRTRPGTPPGTAGQHVAELGDRARIGELYGPSGAAVYDDVSAGDVAEVRQLLRIVRRRPGPVLELAAGSGRITLPLLALGRRVTALDRSDAMVDLLTQRLHQAPAMLRERCAPVCSDMTDFWLPDRFTTVLLATTSISLLDSHSRPGLYRSVLRHLVTDGRFFISNLDRYDTADTAVEAETPVVGASGTAYRFYEHWPADAGYRTVTVIENAVPRGGPVQVCTGRVRVVDTEQLRNELSTAGLTVRRSVPWSDPGQRHRVTLLEAEATR